MFYKFVLGVWSSVLLRRWIWPGSSVSTSSVIRPGSARNYGQAHVARRVIPTHCETVNFLT